MAISIINSEAGITIDHNDQVNRKTPKPTDEISRKVGDVSYSILRSHMAGLVFKTALALGFTAVVIGGGILAEITAPITVPIAIAVGVTILIAIEVIRYRKKVLYEISLIYTVKSGGHDWWTPITDNIVLGAIPLEHQLDRLKESNVSAVLTMLEPFERERGLVKPLNREDYEKAKIDNYAIETADFLGVPVESIVKGVEYVKKNVDLGEKVYIHCKAGRGRSATIVVAYFLKYGTPDGKKFSSVEEAYKYVKAIRPQINLNPRQQAKIKEYYAQHCQVATAAAA